MTRREDGCADKPELTVVVPEDPPLLTPPAAGALLRLLRHADARRSGPAQVVPLPRHHSDDGPSEHGREAA